VANVCHDERQGNGLLAAAKGHLYFILGGLVGSLFCLVST